MLPASQIVLMSVLPAETVDDARVTELNDLNGEAACERSYVEFLDIHDDYLNEAGERDESLYDADGVHLNGHGYLIWIDAITRLIGHG